MLRKSAIAFMTAVALAGVVGCNSSSPWDNHLVLQTSVAVTGFSLAENDKILSNLDSVYFSIDLDKAEIYNADSLPLGTQIDRLVVNITTDGTSVCELRFPTRNGVDTVVNYLESTTDSINFSKGPVRLHIVSVDGMNKRDYLIKVNVHKMKPDSLAWNRAARRSLPSKFAIPAGQKTVQSGETLYCLTSQAGAYCMASAAHPESEWVAETVTFPFTPAIESLEATSDALFILSDAGELYKSTDGGRSWASVAQSWHSILGAYGDLLLGVKSVGGRFVHASYPESVAETAVPEQFPVEGASRFYTFTTKWAQNPQVIMVGGRNSSGDLVNRTWAFDGKNWADLTQAPLGAAEGITLVPYYESKTSEVNWKGYTTDVLLAIGGRKANGTVSRDVYVSSDLGFHWRKASSLMQLPSYIPAMAGAQAFVYDLTNTISPAKGIGVQNQWQEYDPVQLPMWFGWADESALRAGRGQRAVKPVTSWTTPYIYMFGGCNQEGTLYNTVWRAVLNRLEFQPLQ